MTDLSCPTCRAAAPSSTRYCALTRCYCGHEACPAFASWQDTSIQLPAGEVADVDA